MKKSNKLLALLTVIVMVCASGTLAACQSFGNWEITKEPTCTETGIRIRHKIKDESTIETEIIPALGHDWLDEGDEDGWVVTVEPTYTTEGEAQRICGRCGHKETKILDMIEEPVHLKIMDGDKLIKKVYVEEDGSYDLTDVEVSKLGYTFDKFVTDTGSDFVTAGSITENTDVYTSWVITPTTTLSQLTEYAAGGVDKILIAADIEITESVFVVDSTEIYVTEDHTLTRGTNFAGDLFVVGETPEGGNTQVTLGTTAVLTLKPQNGAALTIDGNKDDVEAEVSGTAILVLYSSVVNMHDGVTIQNCRKVKNAKLLTQENGKNKYALSYINRIGGAAAIVVNGTFNMYGGEISDNEVNTVEADTDDDGDDYDDIARTSTCGGAIYNNSNVYVYGGKISGNKASRGGAIYDYRNLTVTGGELSSNQATVYGGAVYLPGSQYAQLFVGSEDASENLVTFDANSAGKSGGAIFGQMKNSVTVYGATTFSANTASGNGGAINTSGALTVKDATFRENVSASKGGAIYVYYSDSELTTRQVNIEKGLFDSNEASKGGAIAFSASDEKFEKGSIGFIGEVTFKGNRAFTTATDDPDLSDSEDDAVGGTFNGNGGAIYIARSSDVTISGATFETNNAGNNGGAIYVTGSSRLVITDGTSFEANVTFKNGGAIFATSDKSYVEISDAEFVGNKAEGNTDNDEKDNSNGGAIYVYGSHDSIKNVITLKVSDSTFNGNSSKRYAGAIFGYKDSVIEIENCDFTSNVASLRGGAIFLSGANATIKGGEFAENESTTEDNGGETGGAIAFYSGTTMAITDVTFSNNRTDGNGGALYIYSSTATITKVTFDGNSSKLGGAIYLTKSTDASSTQASSATLSGCTFTENTSSSHGGAIGAYQESNVTFSGNTVFEGNTAGGNGGAVYISSAGTKVTMDGVSTFTGNSATGNGGAIYVTGGDGTVLRIKEVNATENSAASGGFLYITTKKTAAYIYGGTIENNAAPAGKNLSGNADTAYVHIRKAELNMDDYTHVGKYTLDEEFDEEWGAWQA